MSLLSHITGQPHLHASDWEVVALICVAAFVGFAVVKLSKKK